jgi:hypothetical protein
MQAVVAVVTNQEVQLQVPGALAEVEMVVLVQQQV